ncbi:TolC family protein [Phenylobacterium sp.]|uniref:TolC family protein n=1 Tax=Phenylobacterium sp. TaxID=1871053 RepID=UPI002F422267
MPSLRPAALLACLALAACASSRPPQVRLPAAYEAPARGGLAVEALDRWWTAFDDAQLAALVEQALAASPDARTAAARLDEARATAHGALTHFLPQGDATASAQETHSQQLSGTVVNIPGFSTSGASDRYAANFDVSWELDLVGRFFAVRRAARGDQAAARFEYEGTRASLAANVADAYFQARGLAIQLADADETVRIQNELETVALEKAGRGLGARADADRVAGDLAQAASQAATLQAELQAARRTLLVLLGRGAEPIASVPITAGVGAIPPVPATTPSELLARRPDVREARARLASAAGRSDVALLAFFPTFTLTPGLGWSKLSQPGYSATTQTWTLGGNVSQPILSIPQLLFDLKAQNARTRQAAIAYEKTVQTAFGEAESALARLDADRRGVALLQDGEVRARRAYEAARTRYNLGLDDLEGALAAERSWRATRSALTAAQVQGLRRAVQTYKALGGGWPAQTLSAKLQAG